MTTNTNLKNWQGCKRPFLDTFEGRFCRLERLSAKTHGDGLYAASSMKDSEARFRWLFELVPPDRTRFQPWLEAAQADKDQLFYAVIDKASGRIGGRQAFMRIDEKNGSIEIGNILWSSLIARTPITTEAFFLFGDHIFTELGYRRFEWKCNNRNEASKRAALRFGMKFEGIFRQHLVVKGENRDTAWFSITDEEWPALRAAFAAWLSPENFDDSGMQVKKLADFRTEFRAE